MDPFKKILRFPYMIFLRGIHFCYIKWIASTLQDEDDRRKEFIANIILVASIIATLLLTLFTLYSRLTEPHSSGVLIQIFVLIPIAFIALYILSRKGYTYYVSYVLVAFYLGITISASHAWGVTMPAGLLAYAFIIIVSSVLISGRFAIFISIIISIALIFMGIEVNGSRDLPAWRYEPVYVVNTIEYAIILTLITLISWVSSRQIEISLERARRSERELKRERDQLEEKVVERTEALYKAQIEKISQLYRFAEFGKASSGLFHDLINPLTALSLNINELRTVPIQPQLKNSIDKALEVSKHVEELIKNIRIQLNADDRIARFSPTKDFLKVVELLKYRAQKLSIKINTFVTDTPVFLLGSHLKFNQIILNLLSNAIDACEKNKGSISIALLSEGDMLKLQIKDTGSGMAPTIVPQIFDPFFTTKSKEKGTGLGLSTTKTIIEKEFKGSIKVESTIGIGTTFTVYLPAHYE